MSLMPSRHASSKDAASPLTNKLSYVKAVLDSLQANVFVADTKFTMVYANPKAMKTMAGFHHVVKETFDVEMDEMVGDSIHRFHHNPARVEAILGDVSKLPHSATFNFGSVTLETEINAVKDGDEVVGYAVVWVDATLDESIRNAATVTATTLIDLGSELDQLTRQLEGQATITAEGAATAAAAVEEMSASVQEISNSASQAVTVAREAVDAAANATDRVTQLNSSSQEIGMVVKLITQIAEQTNLLALNATIEAARAGDAGRGFAVVAGEVKELARETAEATQRITAMIDALQGDSTHVSTALNAITDLIHQISDAQTSIAGAVEEQSATTNEISRSVNDVAGTADVTNADLRAVMERVAQVRETSLDLKSLAAE